MRAAAGTAVQVTDGLRGRHRRTRSARVLALLALGLVPVAVIVGLVRLAPEYHAGAGADSARGQRHAEPEITGSGLAGSATEAAGTRVPAPSASSVPVPENATRGPLAPETPAANSTATHPPGSGHRTSGNGSADVSEDAAHGSPGTAHEDPAGNGTSRGASTATHGGTGDDTPGSSSSGSSGSSSSSSSADGPGGSTGSTGGSDTSGSAPGSNDEGSPAPTPDDPAPAGLCLPIVALCVNLGGVLPH